MRDEKASDTSIAAAWTAWRRARPAPGMRICHPGWPDRGVGQMPPVVGHRLTVGFGDVGKVLVSIAVVTLEPVED